MNDAPPNASRRHYFAAIREVWRNLPEAMHEQFPSVTHLRKYALIKCGYLDQHSIAFKNAEDAETAAMLVGELQDMAICAVDGCTVHIYIARSQSQEAMGAADFEQSKEAVLDYLADLVA